METLFIDHDFIDTYGLTITSGRNFSREFSTDTEQAFILNETAVQKLGWDDPIGKRFSEEDAGVEAIVVGVIKDFHYDSILYEIAPMVRNLCKETGFKLKYIYELFPNGPANGACKVAGLPKPTGCV